MMNLLWILLQMIVLIFGQYSASERKLSDGLTGTQIENAFNDTFAGDTTSMKEITCEAEHEALESSSQTMPEGVEVTIDCSIDGDVATCSGNMTMTVEGADPISQTLPEFKIAIVDGKLCGTAE